jgi:hypothetical protein
MAALIMAVLWPMAAPRKSENEPLRQTGSGV